MRLAYASRLSAAILNARSLEPTQVAGFSQVFDDFLGVKSERLAAGIDHRLARGVHLGAEGSARKLDFKTQNLDTVQREQTHSVYVSSPLPGNGAATLRYVFDRFETEDAIAGWPRLVRTEILRLRVVYALPPYWNIVVEPVAVRQKVRLSTDYQEEFGVLNLELARQLPGRNGHVSLQVRNAFDETFAYQDRNFQTSEPVSAEFVPERSVMLKISLSL